MIEITGFSLRIISDSLNNNNDQWSDLSIILQLLKRKSDKLYVMSLSSCGVSSIKFLNDIDG